MARAADERRDRFERVRHSRGAKRFDGPEHLEPASRSERAFATGRIRAVENLHTGREAVVGTATGADVAHDLDGEVPDVPASLELVAERERIRLGSDFERDIERSTERLRPMIEPHVQVIRAVSSETVHRRRWAETSLSRCDKTHGPDVGGIDRFRAANASIPSTSTTTHPTASSKRFIESPRARLCAP